MGALSSSSSTGIVPRRSREGEAVMLGLLTGGLELFCDCIPGQGQVISWLSSVFMTMEGRRSRFEGVGVEMSVYGSSSSSLPMLGIAIPGLEFGSRLVGSHAGQAIS